MKITHSERLQKAKRAAFDAYYSNLNEMQRQSVYSVNGPLLVLAGAGTGKTTVLVNRIAHIATFGDAYESEYIPENTTEADITALENASSLEKDALRDILIKYSQGRCPAYAMLAITFTNKAAGEMKSRLSQLLGDDCKDMWIGTFHATCVKLLRMNAARIGYTPNFTIYDSDDSKKAISECMKKLNIDDKILPVNTVINKISRAKDMLIGTKQFTIDSQNDFRDAQIATIYELYEHNMKSNNAMDFDDLIFNTVMLLREYDDVRQRYASRFRYISVDEFQDTNYAQNELVKLLASEHGNIMAVGDDDQSIYKFRGATIKNILQFDETYKDCKVIKLERNYRSTGNILEAANSVIRNNNGRRGKELYTEKNDGAKIHIKKLATQNDEARYIIAAIKDGIVKSGRQYSDYAILYRVNAQANAIQLAFGRSGIPFRVVGGRKFYDKKEIKDVLAYLTVINNTSDNLRLKRIINEPKRKIGESTIEAVEKIAEDRGADLFTVMKSASEIPQLAKTYGKLERFAEMITKLHDMSLTVPLQTLTDHMLELTGYRDMLDSSEAEEDRERLENIEELKSSMIQYELGTDEPTLDGFLQSISLVTDVDSYDTSANAVTMMTIHCAKGLEFPIVFLPGMEEGLFPGQQALNDPEEVEEERRLAYVAMTRAKEQLYLLHCTERMLYGRTSYNPVSMFVTEVTPELTDSAIVKKPIVSQQHVQIPQSRRRHPLSNEIMKDSDTIMGVGKTQGYEIFVKGDRVSHMTFGVGTVTGVTEMGADIMYEIVFDDHGKKRLMATYAKLCRAES